MKDIEMQVSALKAKTEQKESRIASGIITNDKTLKYAKREIAGWRLKIIRLRNEHSESNQ